MPPKTMTAIEAKGAGGPEVLVAGSRTVPEPGPVEVLIEALGDPDDPAQDLARL